MRRRQPSGCALLFVIAVTAGEFGAYEPVRAEGLPRHVIFLDGSVNGEDALLGGTYRFLASPQLGLGPFASFEGLLEGRTVREEIGPHFYIQRQESRYLGAVGLDGSRDFMSHVGVFAAAGAGYTFGSFEGTHVQPDEGWTPLFRIGILAHIASNSAQIRAGYEYADLRSRANNRAYFAAGIEF